MDEQFILRVPPSVSERIERLLNEDPSLAEADSLDLSFSEDGRGGTFVIGNDRFPASLLDLPCIVESYKTYDDNVLIKTSDIGQIIMVREEGDPAPEGVEYRHGLTPPMRDARRRHFRREPDLNPELVQRVEKDVIKIMQGGTAENVDILLFTSVSWDLIRCFHTADVLEVFSLMGYSSAHVEAAEQEEDGEDNGQNVQEKTATLPPKKSDTQEVATNGGEPDHGDSSEDSDDSI